MEERDARRFTVRCRGCGRTVLSGVERVGDAEPELHAHLAKCQPDLAAAVSAEQLGELLARFDVRAAE